MAWTSERALELLREGVGTHFDGKVVGALEPLVGAGEPEPAAMRVRAGVSAAQPV